MEDTFAYEPSPGFVDCPRDYTATVGQDPGRIETRRCGVMGAPDDGPYVEPEQVGTDLQSLIIVDPERRCGCQVTTQVRYFISRPPPQAATLRAVGRNPWRIENALHWVRDAAFREDDSGSRRDQAPPAVLRRIALNVLKQPKTATLGVANKRLKTAWDLNYRVKLLEVLRQGN